MRIGLLNATTNGLLTSTGAATLAGTLDVYLTGGFVPDLGAVFDVITYSSHTGAFTILRGETPGGVMDFAVDTTTDSKVLKIRNITVSTVLPGTDLVATDLALAPGSVVQSGATVTVQWNDGNTGTLATTSSWADRLVVRNLGTNEVLVDMLVPYDAAVSGPIAGGGSAARQATFVLPDGPRGAGAMSVTVTLDVANDVAETNAQGTAELNNVATLPFTAALAPYPDLAVTDVILTPGTDFVPGSTVSVAWRTRNLGDGVASGAWDETVLIRNLTTGQTLFTLHLPYDATGAFAIAAGGFVDHSLGVIWPTGSSGVGRIEFTVTTDAAGQLFENNGAGTAETNNATQLVVLSAPDLTVTALAVDNLTPQSGAQITITWTDVNAGTAQVTAGWFDRVLITNQTTGAQLANQQVSVDLSSGGATFPRSFVFRIPDGNAGAGTLRIQVTADINNTVTEVNAAGNAESNNTATLDVASTLALYPDLQVTDLTLTPAAGWQPSSAVIVGWKTRNQGNVATAGSWIESVSVLNLTTGQTLFTQAVPYDAAAAGAIAAGAFADRSVLLTWPAGTSGLGQFRFMVTTDSTGQVFENNGTGTAETNNTAQLTILSAPDLRVANLAATAAQAGGSVTVSWDDLNAGSATPIAGWSDRLVVRNLDTNEVFVDSVLPFTPVTLPAPGDSRSRSYLLILPDGARGAGQIQVSVTVDSSNVVPEANAAGDAETNNVAVLTFASSSTPYADLKATSVQAPASGRGGRARRSSGPSRTSGWLPRRGRGRIVSSSARTP